MRLWVSLAFCAAAMAAGAQTDWSRYRVYVNNEQEAQLLSDSSLQLYADYVTLGSTDVIVGPGQLPILWSLGLTSDFVQTLPPADGWKDRVSTQDDNYQLKYLRYDAIIAEYEEWRAAYPRYVTRQQIGTTIGGRPIWVYRLWNPDGLLINEPPPKSIYIEGAIHAREWIAANVPMYVFDQSLKRMLAVPSFLRQLHRTAVYVVPVINPDGYEYAWTNDRYWRKNRKNNGGGSYGVDLNRNFEKGWGQNGGSSSNPDSETYRGSGPFSELESQAVRDFANSLNATNPIVGSIDFHNFGEYVLWPWGYTTQRPPNEQTLIKVGTDVKNGIKNSGGHTYTAGQCSTTLYIASGVVPDWFFSQFNAPSLTIELRDTGQYGFELPESQILPTQKEAFAGWLAFLNDVAP